MRCWSSSTAHSALQPHHACCCTTYSYSCRQCNVSNLTMTSWPAAACRYAEITEFLRETESYLNSLTSSILEKKVCGLCCVPQRSARPAFTCRTYLRLAAS